MVLQRTVCREVWSATSDMHVTTEALATACLGASSILWLVNAQVMVL